MGSDFLTDATLGLRRRGASTEQVEFVQQERRAAARVVAGTFARAAGDCAELLSMLGLTPQDGLDRKQVQA